MPCLSIDCVTRTRRTVPPSVSAVVAEGLNLSRLPTVRPMRRRTPPTVVAVELLASVLPSWMTGTGTGGPLSGSEGSGTAVADGGGVGSAGGGGVAGTGPLPLGGGDGRG